MKKIVDFKDFYLKQVYLEAMDVMRSLQEEYGLIVKVSDSELKIVIEQFYEYYASLGISYEFVELMICHFHDVAIMAIDDACVVDFDFVLRGLEVSEFYYSAVEVEMDDVRTVICSIKKLVKG